ncbi:MAG: VacJ family lipoprotein [Candidatus Methylomirabilia bacterium]
MPRGPSRLLPQIVAVVIAVAITILVGASSAIGETADSYDRVPGAQAAVKANDSAEGARERTPRSSRIGEDEMEEYDPWEPFNEAMFSFNRKLDRFLLKPAARVWDKAVPDPVERGLDNAFDNLSMPRRLVNNLLQLKVKGAGQELARFLLNTTVGIAGFFDVAKELGIEQSNEDTGQTFAVYGAGPGPYLVLPFLPPLTVRDGIGFAADAALDPFNYVIFPIGALTGIGAGERLNDRALNLELFETVEESALDLYSGVRNAYLQRRQKAIEE